MSNVRTCKEDWSEDQNTDTGALEDMQTTPMLHVGACQREKYLHCEPKQATVQASSAHRSKTDHMQLKKDARMDES